MVMGVYKCANCNSVVGSTAGLNLCPYCGAMLNTNEVSSGGVAVEIDEPNINTKKQVVRKKNESAQNNTSNGN